MDAIPVTETMSQVTKTADRTPFGCRTELQGSIERVLV